MCEFTIKAVPFTWNDNFSEVALEDFSLIQRNLSYGTCQTIGMALAKLELMEEKGLNPDTIEKILERLQEESYTAECLGAETKYIGLDKAIEIIKKETTK